MASKEEENSLSVMYFSWEGLYLVDSSASIAAIAFKLTSSKGIKVTLKTVKINTKKSSLGLDA